MGALEGRNPIEDYQTIVKELENYNKNLLNKEEIIIANKMDLDGASENLLKFKKAYPNKKIYEVIGMAGVGLNEVIEDLGKLLETVKLNTPKEEKVQSHVLYKFTKEPDFTITKEKDTWVIKGEKPEKILRMTKFNTDEAVLRFENKLKKLGIDDELDKLGALDGDNVRILDFEFEYRK
jgi:GTP-binding protein